MDGSKPLGNARHEAFADFVAGGMDHAAAWAKTLPFGSKHSGSKGALKVSAHRVFHRADVQARIAYLRADALNAADAAPEPFDTEALGELMHEASGALRAAHEVAERCGASPQQRTKIRKALTVHAGRAQRLDAPEKEPMKPDPAGVDVTAALTRLHWCSCHV